MAAGVLLAFACFNVSWHVALWMGPVIAGLLLSLPLSWWTARPPAPHLALLLSTPEDRVPPPVVLYKEARTREWRTLLRTP
jgi:membrane glycosyltransferase